jgi:two-component system nitrate/nitrite response regulator NarL
LSKNLLAATICHPMGAAQSFGRRYFAFLILRRCQPRGSAAIFGSIGLFALSALASSAFAEAREDDRRRGIAAAVPPRVRVVVVDGHPLQREGICRALRDTQIETVGEVADVDAALPLVRLLEPDVVVVGHRKGGVAGAQFVERLRQARSTTRLIVITDDADPIFTRRIMEAGAASALPRWVSGEQLSATVVACSLVGVVLPWDQVGHVNVCELHPTRTGMSLSAREREVLQLLARDVHPDAIARELFLSTTTVRTHLSRIYRKLDVSGAAAAVAEAMRNGLVE